MKKVTRREYTPPRIEPSSVDASVSCLRSSMDNFVVAPEEWKAWGDDNWASEK